MSKLRNAYQVMSDGGKESQVFSFTVTVMLIPLLLAEDSCRYVVVIAFIANMIWVAFIFPVAIIGYIAGVVQTFYQNRKWNI